MDIVELIVIGTLISYGIWGIIFMKKNFWDELQ